MIPGYRCYMLFCTLWVCISAQAQDGREDQRNSEIRAEAATNVEQQQANREGRDKQESPEAVKDPEKQEEIKKEETKETPQQVKEPRASEKKAPIVDEPKPSTNPRLRPIKPQFDRSGSFIGNTVIPLMPSLDLVADFSDKQQDSNATFEPGELLATNVDMRAAMASARQLQAFGLRVKSRQQLSQLGLVLTRFRLPAGADAGTLLLRIQKQFPDLTIDTNQRYQLLNSSRKTWAHTMLAWPAPNSACLLEHTSRIGMVDTSINQNHPALSGSALVVENFFEGEQASSNHGTAVASLLTGNSENGFSGLVPTAELFAAGVFRQRGDHTDTTTSALLHALEWLSAQGVSVINLSLGGEHNRILEQAIMRVLALNVTVVAAAGNEGPAAKPIFPAAQEGVIAVTAVDAAGQIYAQANQGDYIDFAAPGVDVWAASGEAGGQYLSGTSFAAPFVTASLALANALEEIRNEVEDKGIQGKDPVFGWGLIKAPKTCRH